MGVTNRSSIFAMCPAGSGFRVFRSSDAYYARFFASKPSGPSYLRIRTNVFVSSITQAPGIWNSCFRRGGLHASGPTPAQSLILAGLIGQIRIWVVIH